MRWQGRRASSNVEDRRGAPRGLAVGGGVGTVVIVILYLLLGGDPAALQNLPVPGGAGAPQNQLPDEQADELKQFASVVLADTEDVWNELFQNQLRKPYREPQLVLFSGQVQSACGAASSATGPFYCPGDQKVYLDLSFFEELRSRFQAPGDFAMAYVIAHEVGHHVQNQLGITDLVHNQRRQLGDTEYNRLSVRLELQADFLAGVWAHHAERTKQILEAGDVEEALGAANAIGDDRLQKQARGQVVPDSFTHGTSAQRVKWFKRGLQSGDLSALEELFDLPYEQL